MSNRLTASVVGAGSGGKLSMAALAASDRFDLAGVADISPEACEAAAEAYPGIETFADHEEMFSACPTDVVCVGVYLGDDPDMIAKDVRLITDALAAVGAPAE